MYDVVKFLHVAAAIVWVGGGTWTFVLMRRLQAAGAGPAMGPVQEQVKWFGQAVVTPAAILALFSGLYMVMSGGFSPEQWWIVLGLVAIFVTTAIGMGVISPTAGKLGALMAEHGPGHPDLPKLQQRMKTAIVFNLTLLWVVVFSMVLGSN